MEDSFVLFRRALLLSFHHSVACVIQFSYVRITVRCDKQSVNAFGQGAVKELRVVSVEVVLQVVTVDDRDQRDSTEGEENGP